MLDSGLLLVLQGRFLLSAKPEEGLKIDESSQNQFIAPEILACVMSGKIVLLFCLLQVHEAAAAPKWLTIKVRWFFFLSFLKPLHCQRAASRQQQLHSDVKCDEMLVLSGSEVFCFLRLVCILPGFKVDEGHAHSLFRVNPRTILNKFSLLPLCYNASV